MNSYGELARDLWRAADARRYDEMSDRDAFFADLGRRVSDRVDELVPVFAGEAPAGEPGRLRELRLRRAKKQAEEVAFQELIFSQTVAPAAEVFADA